MTNFDSISRFDPNDITFCPNEKFERHSSDLKEMITAQSKLILINRDFRKTLSENELYMINTLDQVTFEKFMDALVNYFSRNKYRSDFISLLRQVDPKCYLLFNLLKEYIKVEVE